MAFKLKSGNKTNFKGMGSSPAKDMKTGSYKQSFESPTKQTKFPIPAAKRITKKHVGHTTVDAPKPQDESKFDKSQRKMQHVDKLLKRAGYDLGEREQATGAGGYKAAMDWATSKEKSPAKQKSGQVVIDGKTYPEGYTKEDVKFLEGQREDVVRYEDLDKKGKALWRKQGKPVPKKK